MVLPDGITRYFQRGESVPVWGWNEVDDAFADPSEGMTLTLQKPDGTPALAYDGVTPITDLALTKDETGKFVYKFHTTVTDATGTYKGWLTAQDGTGESAWITITPVDFTIESRN